MPMNFDGLSDAYWTEQGARVERLRAKIAAREAVPVGRVVPDDSDLAIGSGRRLSLTLLFLDISGFSQRQSITAAEQEMMLRILNLFLTEMIRVIEDYGGHVEKNTGDGLMAYFEDDAGAGSANSTKKAVACALTMDATNHLLVAPILRASDVKPIEFRVSIEHGAVTIARIGAAQRFSANVAIGNAANFAAKMLGNLTAGQIGLGSNARVRLPSLWQQSWTQLAPVSTGWTFVGSGLPYPLYLYTGRWTRLV